MWFLSNDRGMDIEAIVRIMRNMPYEPKIGIRAVDIDRSGSSVDPGSGDQIGCLK
jgi:hypothetical protein